MILSGWYTGPGVIDRLVEPETSDHFQGFQTSQVLQHCLRLDRKTKQRGVRSDDQVFGEVTLKPQVGYAKGAVLVVHIYIEGEVTRL